MPRSLPSEQGRITLLALVATACLLFAAYTPLAAAADDDGYTAYLRCGQQVASGDRNVNEAHTQNLEHDRFGVARTGLRLVARDGFATPGSTAVATVLLE